MAEVWEVVGGTDVGGIIVRKGVEVKSEAYAERLSTGALIEGLSLNDGRLQYKKLTGSGPETGWVTIKLKTKDLVVRTTKEPPAQQAPPGAAAAPGGAAPASGGGAQNGAAAGQKQADDIFAALDALDQPAKPSEALESSQAARGDLLDRLFAQRDSDEPALREALHAVATAAAEDSAVNWHLWHRALPMLMDNAERSRKANLFGLLVDYQNGLFANSSRGSRMNEVACELPPQGSPSGLVIFLLGWGGGTAGDLDDIAALYRQLYPDSIIVRLTCCAQGSFGLRCECAYGIRAASQAFAHAPQGSAPKLLVHLFSNAGFHTWTEMLRSWDTISSSQEQHPSLAGPLPRMADVLRGVVLDSACNANVPIESCIQSLLQGMAGFIFQVACADHDGSESGKKAAERNGKKAMLILLADQSPVRAHLNKKHEGTLIALSNADAATVHELEPPVEMQFVYSRDDTIIAFHGIEDYINEVVARPSRQGVPSPQSLVFDKSKHVFHKAIHKDAYSKCVERFSSAALSK